MLRTVPTEIFKHLSLITINIFIKQLFDSKQKS